MKVEEDHFGRVPIVGTTIYSFRCLQNHSFPWHSVVYSTEDIKTRLFKKRLKISGGK